MKTNKEIHDILEGLVNAFGMLTPERVLEYAEPEDSPLHEYFEWNDSSAAQKYRIEQARGLIRSVTITSVNAPDTKLRAYVSMADDRLHGAGYRRMDDVLSNTFLRTQLAKEMLSQAQAWQKRAELVGSKFDTTSIERQANRIKRGK